ncbi:NAD(P)H-binding protein [Solidesulfovibrio sp.]|uniref:NmrA family NAD(P)-binding protein n=1 Tax=Solidesulfovibrio sp. TaxID=2910990 RepID=UPI0026372AE4|nr:NAD(P)H-binding protein [Solidesulfovibrio sp.]
MKETTYLVTGATSRTGSAAARHLLDNGARVRVLGRSAERLAPLADRGAEVRVVDPLDAPGLARAFAGADAAYVMLQPNYIPDHPDFRGFQDRLVENLGLALERSDTARAVALSSWGADLPEGNGPVAGLRRLEERLGRIPGLDLLSLRAGYFLENLYALSIEEGALVGPLRPETPLPFVAARDVGTAAAAALLASDFSGKAMREVKGPRPGDMTEAASLLGQVLGRSALPYAMESAEAFEERLRQAGCAGNVVRLMLEVVAGINSGRLRALTPHSAKDAARESLETFVREQWAPRLAAQRR